MARGFIEEETEATYNTYAAIKLTRDTILNVVASVEFHGTPQGAERLVYALFTYKYEPGVAHYYIGGNYLKNIQPNYHQQILTQTELDTLFTYAPRPEKKGGRRDPDTFWFPVTLREQHPDMIVQVASGE
jgi:HKD family nuclease